MRPFFLTFAAMIIAAPACAGDATLLGTGVGAAIGGLFGSQFGHGAGQFATTTLGIAAGAAVGNTIGQSIDNGNRPGPVYGGASAYQPPPPIVYSAATPNYVAPPAPPPTYIYEEADTYCRPYSQRILIDGRMRESYGTACLQPDGSWRIVQ